MQLNRVALAVVAWCVACGEKGQTETAPVAPTMAGVNQPRPGEPAGGMNVAEPEARPRPEPGPGDPSEPEPGTEVDPGPAASGPGTDPIAPGTEECESTALPSPPLRRLSSDEYHNTLRDLFGEELGPRVVEGSLFPTTRVTSGFSTDAEANIVNTSESNAIESNAERIATLIDQDPTPFLRDIMPCPLAGGATDEDIDACVDRFIADFGARAYRRPLSPSEVELARRAYDQSREAGDARFAFAGLVQYFVQSPALLYRIERGVGGPNAALLQLDGYERATRLSYFLTGSMPDDELMAAAEADALATPEQVRAQAERLLESERFVERAAGFHRDWLELSGLSFKDTSLFPTFDAARNSLGQETSRYVRYVLEEGDGRIATLLGGTTFPVDEALAAFYGVTADGASADNWIPVELPNRRGLITQAALMATLATETATHPIHRGRFVNTQLLCRNLPALPANLDIQGPLVDTSTLPTARERLAPLTQNGDCSVCHTLINPVGLAFEPYDGAGAFRETENGSPIDASGSLRLDGAEIEFDGPVALAEAIANSDEAQACYTLFWYRAAMGRPDYEEDECSVQMVSDAVVESGGDVRELLLSLVETDAFLLRRPHQP